VSLVGNAVHVGIVHLRCGSEVFAHLGATLSEDERASSEKLWFTEELRRFLFARPFPRMMLSGYKSDPSQGFIHDARGKLGLAIIGLVSM
jgi:hypothetical protein